MSKFASGKKAWAISQRSGLRYPYNQMIFEEGTNLFIHKSESDGIYNEVDHPQRNIKGVKSDAQALPYVSGDYGYSSNQISLLSDTDGQEIVFIEMFGVELAIII